MASHKSVNHDSKCPNVDRERVGLAIKNLRRNVTFSSAECRASLSCFQLFGIAKISDDWDVLECPEEARKRGYVRNLLL